MELTLKHLAPYLPYKLKFLDLKCEPHDNISVLESLNIYKMLSDNNGNCDILFKEIKPILRPLSEFGDSDDLRKVHEFIGLGNWCDMYDNYFNAWFDDACGIYTLVLQCPYEVLQYFLKNHYDIFGLIENKLAIDINTLNK